MIGMVAFLCENPFFSVSRFVDMTYTRIMEFRKFIREKSGKIQGILLGTLFR